MCTFISVIRLLKIILAARCMWLCSKTPAEVVVPHSAPPGVPGAGAASLVGGYLPAVDGQGVHTRAESFPVPQWQWAATRDGAGNLFVCLWSKRRREVATLPSSVFIDDRQDVSLKDAVAWIIPLMASTGWSEAIPLSLSENSGWNKNTYIPQKSYRQ